MLLLRVKDQELAGLRARVQQQEGQLRSKDKELARLTRQTEAIKVLHKVLCPPTYVLHVDEHNMHKECMPRN